MAIFISLGVCMGIKGKHIQLYIILYRSNLNYVIQSADASLWKHVARLNGC